MFKKEEFRAVSKDVEKISKNKVKIISISKNHPINSIKEAINFGIRVFGENRVQEAEHKFLELKKEINDIELHLTGPLQTNKVKSAIKIFDVFHTLDREKLAKEFYKNKELLKNKKFFIQVNIGKESNKHGVHPEMATEFIQYCKNDLNFNIVGLMCIPPIYKTPTKFFLQLKEMATKNKLLCLSMGMSSDYIEAITSGATHIRIGTKFFGERRHEG